VTFSPLFERVQRALSPHYRLERELASGGTGVVFIAHDLTLDCPVAVKVLRPELQKWAEGEESFLREARVLARLRHPNIITVYRAIPPEEGDGLALYIMEFITGGTLADRLESGPLPAPEALELGRDLLDGLEAAHHAGFVHRDIKPANIFLSNGRTVLGDFGLARAPTEASSGEGTPAYMAPEQQPMVRGPVTPRTDLFAVGLVLYEAYTGRRRRLGNDPDWSGVPRPVARVLSRAVEQDPAKRWPDARSFRRALWRTRTRRYVRRTLALTLAGLAVGILVQRTVQGLWPAPPVASTAGAVPVTLPAFDVVAPAEWRWLGDSLSRRVRNDLANHADFRLVGRRPFFARPEPSLALDAVIEVRDGLVHARISNPLAQNPAEIPPAAEVSVPLASWTLLSDSLAYRILLAVWDAQSPLAASLPLRALPRTASGIGQFLEAEQLVAAAKWGEAYRAYTLAEEFDSTCWLCSWRVNDVERWLSQPHDPARIRRVLAHVDSFPPWYQSLIRATVLPLAARLDTLRALTDRSPQFLLGWFQYGDELFHRGPLLGHERAEAIAPLEEAVRLRKNFGPAWEHLAWALTAEGDSLGAARALAALGGPGSGADPFTHVLRTLLDLGFAWRFLSPEEGARRNARLFADPTVRDYRDFGAGPRLLLSFDAPRGAIALGRAMAADSSGDLNRSGLIAEVLGLVATGEVEGARETAARLVEASPEPGIALFVIELDGALALLDSGAISPAAAARQLRPYTMRDAAPEQLRQRAMWMRAMLGHMLSSSGERSDWHGLASPPLALVLVVQADSLAGQGRSLEALALTDGILVDSVARSGMDPFFRAVVRLRRARWRIALGDTIGARRELRWYQHADLVGVPAGLPQAAEVDWAFGTLARWQLAGLGSARSEPGEQCRAYEAVIRNWAAAPSPYRERVGLARERLGALHCADREG